MHNQWISDEFPRYFEAELLEESPYEEPLWFPQDASARARDGLYVRVTLPDGSSWTGKFTFGFPGFPYPSGLVSCPNPDYLLIVSCGSAYYVAVNGAACQLLPSVPVRQIVTSVGTNNLFLVDNTTIVAVDKEGFRWRTKRVVPDDLRIQKINSDMIEVTGFDPARQSPVAYNVSLQSGDVIWAKRKPLLQ